MKLTACILLFIFLCCGCAEQVMPVAKSDRPAMAADYAVVVRVLPGYSYGEVVDAAHSAGTLSRMEIIDPEPLPFTVKTLRFSYRQVQQREIIKVQQRLGRCQGVTAVNITNE